MEEEALKLVSKAEKSSENTKKNSALDVKNGPENEKTLSRAARGIIIA